MKCKCQMISELIERNMFLERQIDYAISIESAFELMEVVSINEERISKLKRELMKWESKKKSGTLEALVHSVYY